MSSYESIRDGLDRHRDQPSAAEFTENEKLLLDALRQLTSVLESDLTQIKVALGHVARLLESGRN
jgi:hypothetical protein